MNPENFIKPKENRSKQQVNGYDHNHRNPTRILKNSSLNRVLVVTPQGKWHEQRMIDRFLTNKESIKQKNLTPEQIAKLRTESIQIIKTDCYNYEQMKSNSSMGEDHEWIKTVLTSGTVNDKLAAYTVMIQDSPVHNLKSIESLIRFINPKGKRECMMAIDNVRDLFIGDLLIPKQKLRCFEEQLNSANKDFLLDSANLDNPSRKKFLLLAHFEDQIRSFYKRFLEQLVQCSHDSLETMKIKSIRTMFDLFVNNPEQEKYLLECLINKLGDPTPKIASTTARLLAQILQNHPQMKMIVVKEVERLIFRPNITDRAQYYCLCFLSEIIFNANADQDLANRCIQIYFAIFIKCTKLGEVNSKTMSTLLTGVSRAFPYSKLEAQIIEEHLNTFYKLIHYVNRNTAIQTLSLIFNMVNLNESGSLSDRFYSVLYRFLLDPNLDQCNKLSLLLNIVYRSIKKDPMLKRVRSFVKRLLQLALISSTSFAISVLILVSELIKTKVGFRLDTIHSENEEMISTAQIKFNDGDETKDGTSAPATSSPKSWVFVDFKNHSLSEDAEHSKDGSYRFDARNPLYANAEYEPYWELLALRKHFHPTVQMFTEKLIHSEALDYDGDPLEDFSLKRFLDRFSFKNPKSLNQKPNCSKSIFSRAIPTPKSGSSNLNINSDDYLTQEEDQIPLDERFIYRFLREKKSIQKERKKDRFGNEDEDDSDIESVDSLEFNELLDNYEKYAGGDDDVDYAKDYKITNETKKKMKNQPDETDDADFDEEFDDDGDDDDEEDDTVSLIDDAFSDNEMELSEEPSEDDASILDPAGDDIFNDSDNPEDADDDDDDFKEIKKPRNSAPFKGKSGFSNLTNDIFASAEQFDHLLDQNEMGSDLDSDIEYDDVCGKNGLKNSKRKKKKPNSTINIKSKRPNLGRNRLNKRKVLLKSMRKQ